MDVRQRGPFLFSKDYSTHMDRPRFQALGAFAVSLLSAVLYYAWLLT